MRHPIFTIALATSVFASFIGLAQASGPVPRTLTGCVNAGALTSSDGYSITVLNNANQRMDLSAYNGKRITVSGNLLPSDRFYPKTPIRVLGPCR